MSSTAPAPSPTDPSPTDPSPTDPAPEVVATATTAPGPDLPDDRGLASVLDDALAADPGRVVFPGVRGHGDVDVRTLHRDVRRLAARLVGRGLGVGERVVVLGRTGYPWVVTDLAVLAVGAVVVPVYPTASAEQIRHILTDSAAVFGLAETAEQQALLDGSGVGLREPAWALDDVVGLDRPEPAARPQDSRLARRLTAVRADDLATIVYTSGTTGLPKGCLLTHRNMYVAAAGVVAQTGTMFGGEPGEQARTVLALPLSHVFGRTVLFACLVGGSATALAAGVPEMLAMLPGVAPTFLTLVPYALEKIRKASTGGPSFGGSLTGVISGGASLDPSTAAWFTDAGVTVLQGYGLTETATAATINGPGAQRTATVGRPIPGVTVAITADGEILVRGANVTSGYWGRGPEHADGWLHTGDLGRLDDDGFLTITGRRKEILVTSGGKNVAPAPLEDRVRLHPLVSNCIVLGDGRTHVTALVTVDRGALAAWAAREGADLGRSLDEDPRVREQVGMAVAEANGLVSRAESIRSFRVLEGDFTIAAGHMTPSMKLRRRAIEDDFAADVTALYG